MDRIAWFWYEFKDIVVRIHGIATTLQLVETMEIGMQIEFIYLEINLKRRKWNVGVLGHFLWLLQQNQQKQQKRKEKKIIFPTLSCKDKNICVNSCCPLCTASKHQVWYIKYYKISLRTPNLYTSASNNVH